MLYWSYFLFGVFLMEKMISKLQNFWFYYKKHLLIALAVLAASGYLLIQQANTQQPDYHIGLVRSLPCTEEERSALEALFTAAGSDLNGDGQVLVKLHTYYVDLAGNGDADVIQALDADLIGNVSGIFLLEDVATFQRVTNGLVSDPLLTLEGGLSLTLRAGAADAYGNLIDTLS